MRYVIVPVTPFQQNCSVLWNEATGVGAVVDPGGDLDRVLDAAARANVRIEKILLTHAHIDHAGMTADLAERLSVPIEGPHPGDRFWIDAMPKQSAMFGFPPMRAFTPDRWLDHGDTVTVGGETLAVLHCPGHTPGHVVFHHAGAKLALVGDVIFKGSVGRSDLPGGDHDTLVASIRERLFPLGDDTRFIPGHGEMSSFGWERKTNPYVADALFA